MTQAIDTAMAEIVRRQGLLTITSPIPATIGKAWDYFPPDSVGLPDDYTFMSLPELIGVDRSSSLLTENYTVHMQLFVKNSDRDVGIKIAMAFLVATIAAFSPHPTLSGTVTDQQIRGGPKNLERAGISYPGLDLFMDVVIKNAMTFDSA